MQNNMIRGLWQITVPVCGNHTDEVVMSVQEGPGDIFYACPKYHEHLPEEKPCFNRIKMKDFEAMLDEVFNKLGEADEKNTMLNLTNDEWEKKGIHFKILLHIDSQFKVSILNKKELAKG